MNRRPDPIEWFRPRSGLTLAACILAAACEPPASTDGPLLGESQGGEPAPAAPASAAIGLARQALTAGITEHGVPTDGNLTRLTFQDPSELSRRAETDRYYQHVEVASGQNIKGYVQNLGQFRTLYGFGGPSEVVTRYYNRADLGIGREMHCVDSLDGPKHAIACYVKNYAAGDDNTEFAFGLSPSIAFANMTANHHFATVAMVYRDQAPLADQVIFMAFDSIDDLSNFAPLDRPALRYQNEFRKSLTVDPKFGTPGVDFNMHIPSNCISCHGGSVYDKVSHSQSGALFLPFDLDNFEFDSAPGRTRAEQEPAFKKLNEMVRKVSALAKSGAWGAPHIVLQLDGEYGNVVNQTSPRTEVFEGNFNSAFVPGWWDSTDGRPLYAVVKRQCQTCHIAGSQSDPIWFAGRVSENSFEVVRDLCSFSMPHSLQTTREFWQSNAPGVFEAYLRQSGHTTDADKLHGCSPGYEVTLDPPLVMSTLGVIL